MSVTPFECGAFFANDNTSAVISPGDNDLVKFIDDDGFVTRARIDGGDTVFATGFVSTSDMNLKTNVRNMPNLLALISQLRPFMYDMREDVMFQGEAAEGKPPVGRSLRNQFGLGAQEVEQILPQLVNTSAEGLKSVDYVSLIPLLIKAIN